MKKVLFTVVVGLTGLFLVFVPTQVASSSSHTSLTSVLLQDSTPAQIEGKYSVKGNNPNGKPYEGTAVIIKNGDTYDVAWTSQVELLGIGIIVGDTFSVTMYTPITLVTADGNRIIAGASGIVAYKIEKEKLSGSWTQIGAPQGKGRVFGETMIRTGDVPKNKEQPKRPLAPNGPRLPTGLPGGQQI